MPKFNDPVSWSVAVLRLGGVTIRLHAVMLATILVLMLRSAWFQGESGGVLGPGFSLVLVACVFWVPFFEEMVLVGCVRRLGGAATEIILHPLGGLDTFVFSTGLEAAGHRSSQWALCAGGSHDPGWWNSGDCYWERLVADSAESTFS